MRKKLISLLLALALVMALAPAAGAVYAEMTVSDGCVDYIEQHEGFTANVYNDGTGYYIGYGIACGAFDYPEGITEVEADALLRQKMSGFSDAVNSFLKKYDVAVTQGQFDALCALAYNLGTGWLSTDNRLPAYLVNGIENYSDAEIMNAFATWCHIGTEVSEGLLKRRVIEGKMFLYDEYADDAGGWYWLVLDANGGTLTSDVYCYKAGTVYGAMPEATREGYTLDGWQTEGGSMLEETDKANENLCVTAVWTEKTAEPESPDEPETPTGSELFSDVLEGIWYYSYVYDLYNAGVINGFPDGTFMPEDNATYGQALKLILLAAGYPDQTRVEDAHWAQCYLDYAVKKGFVKKDSVSDLDAVITRNQMADLTAAALELDSSSIQGNPFYDTSRGTVIALYNAGVIDGYLENDLRYFKGANNISRAEICAVLTRVSDYVDKTLILYGNYRLAINYDLPFSEYDPALFTTGETGRVYYSDDAMDVQYGIDVSYWQGDIDWERVAADGIDYVMIRAGYRGMTSGEISQDEKFSEYITGAKAAGLDVGVYFFSQAISVEEAGEEAQWVLEAVKDYELDYPIAFDWEPMNYTGSRTKTYDHAVLTSCAVAFCEIIDAAGYTPIIYYNKNMAYLSYDLTKLTAYDVWLAQYANVPDYKYDFQMFQYGSSGTVNGIPGRVDMDICFKSYSSAQ